eukprot:3779-Rhodomonas_salina.1
MAAAPISVPCAQYWTRRRLAGRRRVSARSNAFAVQSVRRGRGFAFDFALSRRDQMHLRYRVYGECRQMRLFPHLFLDRFLEQRHVILDLDLVGA